MRSTSPLKLSSEKTVFLSLHAAGFMEKLKAVEKSTFSKFVPANEALSKLQCSKIEFFMSALSKKVSYILQFRKMVFCNLTATKLP